MSSAISSSLEPSTRSACPDSVSAELEGLADLELDAGLDQLDGVAAVEGARHDLDQRVLVTDQLGDACRLRPSCRLRRPRRSTLLDTRGAQDIEPRAVAVIDLGAEVRGGADHVGVGVDDAKSCGRWQSAPG